MPFISLYFLNALATTSNALLNQGSRSGHPCPVPNLRKSFSPLSVMLVVGLSFLAFIECFFHMQFSEGFNHLKKCYILSNVIFASFQM